MARPLCPNLRCGESGRSSRGPPWILGQLIATPVAQKWDGTVIYDVTDTGRQSGYGVRGSWVNVELSFHTDNAFAVAPPDYVGLLCRCPHANAGSDASAASTPCERGRCFYDG